MARQFLPVLWYPSDVDDLKKELLENLTSTDLGVQACTGLVDLTRAQWNIFYADASTWAKSETSIWGLGTQANRGEGYQDELYAWQQQLQTAKCSVPLYNPQPKEPPGTNLTKWLTIGVVAVAGAYVVGRVTEVAAEGLKLVPRRANQ